jgi:hypothetical protein
LIDPSGLFLLQKQTLNSTLTQHHIMKETREMLSEFFLALEQIGIRRLSDEQCCRTAAWLLIYGGGCEAAVTDRKLNTDIRCAQKRLNIFGGEYPNAELLPMLQKYIKECEQFDRNEIDKPQWLTELENHYGMIGKNLSNQKTDACRVPTEDNLRRLFD